MDVPRYAINLFYSAEPGDECWIATVPDLGNSLSTHGDTPEEALHEMQVIIPEVLELLREEGRPIPEPRYRPALAA
jgi:predicted RNase H-like HicB family nuclease